MTVSNKRITKAVIRLRGFVSWSDQCLCCSQTPDTDFFASGSTCVPSEDSDQPRYLSIESLLLHENFSNTPLVK